MNTRNRHTIISLSALLGIVVIGTITFKYLENWTIIEALYFTVATITTVGYGDLHPTSDASRLAAIGLLILGVTTALTSLTVLGTRYINRQERLLERRLRKIAEYMPHIRKKDPDA